MCAIDVDTIKRSKTQFCLRQSSTATPPTPFASSTSAPFASVRGVTLNAIMMQLQLIDARLDTLTTEMYQVNTHAGRIARRQVRLGVFVESPSPPPEASEVDDDSDDDDDDEDGDASSSSTDEMST